MYRNLRAGFLTPPMQLSVRELWHIASLYRHTDLKLLHSFLALTHNFKVDI